MKTVLIGLAIAIILGLIFLGLSKIDFPECVESHTETRHQNAWMQPISNSNGKTTYNTYIYHPERDYEVTVCDKWE